jgi:hypothetical protein
MPAGTVQFGRKSPGATAAEPFRRVRARAALLSLLLCVAACSPWPRAGETAPGAERPTRALGASPDAAAAQGSTAAPIPPSVRPEVIGERTRGLGIEAPSPWNIAPSGASTRRF